jgi:O-antigen/teichoic acid export membrane protein
MSLPMFPTLPSLRRNFVWTLGGNGVYAGCQWGILIAIAKLGSPEMVGQFALALAITAPVFMLTGLQLRIVQATDAGHEYRFDEYFSLRLICSFLAFLIVVAIPIVVGYRGDLAAVIIAVALAKGIESVSDVLYGLLQQHERMDRIARSMMIKGVLSLASLAIAVYFTRSVLSGVVVLTAAWLLVLGFYDIPCALLIVSRKEFKPQWNRSRLLKLTWLTLPMGIVLMLISLNVNIPRYFVESMLGQRQLGIFAAMAYLMQVGGMVMNATGNVVIPRLAKYYAEGQHAVFRNLLAKLLYIAAGLGAASVLVAYYFGHTLLTILYRSEYAEYTDVFTVLMVAAAISYVGGCLGTAVTSVRCFAGQFPVNVGCSLLGLLCSYFAISRMALLGAAVAVLAIAFLSMVGYVGLLLPKFVGSGKSAPVTGPAKAG